MEAIIDMIAVCFVRVGGKRYAPGEPFECTESIGLTLHDNGSADIAVSSDSTDVTSPTGPTTQLDETEQAQAIHDVLVAWIDEDPEQANETRWTKAGKPRNDALDNALDFDVANAVALPIWEQIVKARTVANDD